MTFSLAYILNVISATDLVNTRAIGKAITKQQLDQPTAVADHFTLPGHSMDNIELIPLELITSKAREVFLISKGKTLEPFGLNRREEIWSIYFFIFLFFFIYPF